MTIEIENWIARCYQMENFLKLLFPKQCKREIILDFINEEKTYLSYYSKFYLKLNQNYYHEILFANDYVNYLFECLLNKN